MSGPALFVLGYSNQEVTVSPSLPKKSPAGRQRIRAKKAVRRFPLDHQPTKRKGRRV